MENARDLSHIELMQRYEGQSVDWYLQSLVSLVNMSQLEFGITLVVAGGVVSGKLVGGKKYFETFAEDFSGSWPGDAKEEINKAFARNAEIYDTSNDPAGVPPPQFIHLIDAKIFFSSGSLPTRSGVLWRGRINAVSGFHLGAFLEQE